MPGAQEDNPDTPDPSNMDINWVAFVMVEELPTSCSPFPPMDCMLLSHFSFNDFVVIAFLDLAGDLDIQI